MRQDPSWSWGGAGNCGPVVSAAPFGSRWSDWEPWLYQLISLSGNQLVILELGLIVKTYEALSVKQGDGVSSQGVMQMDWGPGSLEM